MRFRSQLNMTTKVTLTSFRILMGLLFLLAGSSKLISPRLGSDQMLAFLEQQQDMFTFYRTFAENIVFSYPLVFAVLVAFGEILLGIALLLGAKVRFASSLGLLMLLNFMFAKGLYPWQFSGDFVFSALLILFITANAGIYWGFDKNNKLPFRTFKKA